MPRKSLYFTAFLLFNAQLSYGIIKKPTLSQKKPFLMLAKFGEENFLKSMPTDWGHKFGTHEVNGAWEIYHGKFDGFKSIAVGLCEHRIVHLYARLSTSRSGELRETITNSFSDELLSYMVLLEEEDQEGYVLFKDRPKAARCGK